MFDQHHVPVITQRMRHVTQIRSKIAMTTMAKVNEMAST